MAYCVRLMHGEDITQVAEIDREVFPTMPPTNYRHELNSPIAHYIVACDKRAVDEAKAPALPKAKRLSGLILRFFLRNRVPKPSQYVVAFAGLWLMAGETHIINIAVRQSYRRKGIGELLLISLIDLAGELNSFLLTLEVRASNSAAQSLYHKYGFGKKGLRRGYYSDDKEDAVIMTAQDIGSASFQENLNRLKQAHSRKWGIASYRTAR